MIRPKRRRLAALRGEKIRTDTARAVVEHVNEHRQEQLAYLLQFRESKSAMRAAAEVGLSYQAVGGWIHTDPWFREQYELVKTHIAAEIEEIYYHHAVTGWHEPVISQGKPVIVKDAEGNERALTTFKYDAKALEVLARKYLDLRPAEVTERTAGGESGSITLTAEEAAFVRSVIARAKAQGLLNPAEGETTDAKP